VEAKSYLKAIAKDQKLNKAQNHCGGLRPPQWFWALFAKVI